MTQNSDLPPMYTQAVEMLSRRDQFAMAALQGLCANPNVIAYSVQTGWDVVNGDCGTLAGFAYRCADYMADYTKERA